MSALSLRNLSFSYKINIDEEGALAERFAVNSIPTLLIVKDGEEAKRFVGVTPKSKLSAALDELGAILVDVEERSAEIFVG